MKATRCSRNVGESYGVTLPSTETLQLMAEMEFIIYLKTSKPTINKQNKTINIVPGGLDAAEKYAGPDDKYRWIQK